MKFTNENVLKIDKKMTRQIIISFVVILLAYAFFYWGTVAEKKASEKAIDMDTIISDDNIKDKDYQKSYINVKPTPYKFAVYDDTTDSYYFVTDGTYLYIAYMSQADYKKLSDLYDEGKPDFKTRIEGITKLTTKDVKQIAVDSYNDLFEDETKHITIADFENYFGSIYLDMTDEGTPAGTFQYVLFFVTLITGNVLAIMFIVRKISFRRGMKKLDDYEIGVLDKEINDPEAFYYAKANTYLTENYIVSFAMPFTVIKYSDILWMYRYELRRNGVKTNQSIRVLLNNGKTKNIVAMDVFSKKQRDVFDEIWNIIARKNDKMLIGYTKENIDKARKMKKEIKANKTK